VSASASDPGQTATEIGRTVPAKPGAGRGGDPSASAGRRLAHFRLERLLGKGGMGEVWLAQDLALDRPVAVKLLVRDVSDDPGLRERFFREARAQARVHHPNVGHIYYIGEDDGQLFFAMEYIEGESLQDRIGRAGPLSVAEALACCREAALGLREACRMGFTHRDVKPSNLMLDKHGHVKLVDFGIVKRDREGGDVALTADTGGVVGTPLYMAPEQAKSGEVDHRSDIYALGATLHHLLAGKPPFQGATALQLVSKHLTEPRPHLPAATRGRDRGVDDLIDRMMAKEPAERFQDYDDLIAAVDQISPAASKPAGVWVRGFAAFVDFLLVIIASALLALASSALVGLPEPVDDLLLFAIVAVYGIGATGRWGRTAGKALLELEVVPEGRVGRPGWRRAALRFLAQVGPFFLGVGVVHVRDLVDEEGVTGLILVFAGIGLMVTPLLLGALAVLRADRRTLWDRVAGSRVRYRPGGA
jgi:uncharacterized RDD family membrane protein YckC